MILFASLIISLAMGLLLVFIAWPCRKPLITNLSLKLALAVGIGIGISSSLFFLWLVMSAYRFGFASFVIAELLLCAALGAVLFGALKQEAQECLMLRRAENQIFSNRVYYVLTAAFLCATAFAISSFISKSACQPHGGWDAWAIWNMRARFIFRGLAAWKDAFTNVISWTNPDYPLLLPGMIARSWAYMGKCQTLAPAAIALVFTFATIGLLKSSLSLLRGREQGLLGAFILLGTPSFILHGASQYADVPLSFFILASIVILYLNERLPGKNNGFLVLAGLITAFAAWTKNEGLFFLAAVIISRIFVTVPIIGIRGSLRQMAAFLAGSSPILLIIIYFKLFLAPPNKDILAAQISGHWAEKLADPSRYYFIISGFTNEFFRLGFLFTGAVPVLLVYLFLAGISIRKEDRTAVLISILAVLIMLTGYCAIYLTSPYDLKWHIGTTLNRLVLQLWPTIIFIYFMMVSPPGEIIHPILEGKDEKKETRRTKNRR
ncbi:MAG: hypothetical protein NTY76_05265 [Candidatus Omnitrophica bacterium]|nr:hypothetical protein [Candidatus Omnitrophota bacterium]